MNCYITIGISNQIGNIVISYFFLHTDLPLNVFITELHHTNLVYLRNAAHMVRYIYTKPGIISEVIYIVT